MIFCGKLLFVELALPTKVAIPDSLIQAMLQTFPEVTGPVMTRLGFRENPDEPGMPNEQLDMGKFNALLQYPMWLVDKNDSRNETKWAPQSSTFYQGLWDASKDVF